MENHPKYYDRLFGLIMVILAITYGSLALQFQAPFGMPEVVGPKTFPLLIAFLLGLSGLWLVIKPQPGDIWPHGKMWLELLGIAVALVLFAFLLEKLGFIIAAVLCCSYISWRMGAKWYRAIIAAIIYCLVLYFLFDSLLQLSLPKGILAGIL